MLKLAMILGAVTLLFAQDPGKPRQADAQGKNSTVRLRMGS